MGGTRNSKPFHDVTLRWKKETIAKLSPFNKGDNEIVSHCPLENLRD